MSTLMDPQMRQQGLPRSFTTHQRQRPTLAASDSHLRVFVYMSAYGIAHGRTWVGGSEAALAERPAALNSRCNSSLSTTHRSPTRLALRIKSFS